MSKTNTEKMAPETQTPEMANGMKLDVRVRPIAPMGNLLAFANVTIGGCFKIDGFRICSSEKGLYVNMPATQDKCRMGKRINRSFKDCHMPAARTLRGITKVISFVAAIDILFEIAADTAHTGKLRFPGIIFPNKHTNRFSMIPGFVKNPGL